ncbi:hypothetical protein ABPG74_008584 [Tetrahymena malaccensis]
MKYKTQKNITCALITLTAILLSATIVVNFYMDDQVTSTINGISQLTGTNVKVWGDFPGYNGLKLNNTLKFFSLDVSQDATISTMPPGLNCNNVNLKEGNAYEYQHNIVYKNITLQTGSGGYATYYKNESLTEPVDQLTKSQNELLMTVNQGMLQGYYEEIYAPIARKMPLYLYNLKRQMMDTLPTYYAKMMQIFNIGSQKYTNKVVFNPLKIQPQIIDKLWEDDQYGWKNKQTLAKWVSIVLSQQYANHPNFKTIQNYFQLSNDQMIGLAGKSSMLNKLSWLLNGTISDAVYEYGASACQGIGTYCSNSELVSSQWAQGILTRKQIFKYDKNPKTFSFDFNSLNSTIPKNAELGIFAPSPINANDGMNLLQINELTGDMWSPLTVGKTYTLISYYNLANLYNNKNNFGLINFNLKLYNVTKVPPLVSYLDNLENNLILKNDTYPGLGNQETVTSAWFMYRAFTDVFNIFSDVLIGNLYSRAAYNYMSRKSTTCESLFTDPVLLPMLKMCSERGLQQYNVVKSFSANMPFIFAFLGNSNSQDFKNLLSYFQLEDYQLAFFLYNTDKSPYAQLLSQIQSDIQKQYQCLSYCTQYELGRIQWFSGNITNNLPTKYFFPDENVPSIKNWDSQSQLPQKLLPEIYMYTQTAYQKNITFTPESLQNLLNTNIGSILTWSSIHDLILQIIKQDESDIDHDFKLSLEDAKIIQDYLKHVVVEQIFGGMYIQKTAQELLWGYQDLYLMKKASWKQIDGGQPWIDYKRKLLQLNNWQQAANLQSTQVYWVNTGLENMANVNNIQKILGSTQLYQYYTVWSADSTNTNSIQSVALPYYLNQTINGSTGFGFKTKIQDGDSLTLINEKYGRIQKLSQGSKTSYNSQDVYKYMYEPSDSERQTFYDSIQGMMNVTSAARNGLFLSDLYFKNVNQTLIDNIKLNGQPMFQSPQAQSISEDQASSYYLVEPNSGKTINLAQNEQHNLFFNNNLLFDKYHVQNQCFVPFIWNLYNMNYNETLVTNKFSTLNSQQTTKKALLITFIVLTCLCFIGACVSFYFAFKRRKAIRDGLVHPDSRKNSGEQIQQVSDIDQIQENDTSVYRTHNSNNINGTHTFNNDSQA